MEATVIDLGYGGLRLLAQRGWPHQQKLSIEPSQGQAQPVSAKVVWSRPCQGEQETGVVYLGPLPELQQSWVTNALKGLGFGEEHFEERRRFVRWPTELSGALTSQGQEQPITLRDLSLGGALVECTSDWERGQEVQLSLALPMSETLAARVVYQRDRLVGLCFQDDQSTRARARLMEGYLQSMP